MNPPLMILEPVEDCLLHRLFQALEGMREVAQAEWPELEPAADELQTVLHALIAWTQPADQVPIEVLEDGRMAVLPHSKWTVLAMLGEWSQEALNAPSEQRAFNRPALADEFKISTGDRRRQLQAHAWILAVRTAVEGSLRALRELATFEDPVFAKHSGLNSLANLRLHYRILRACRDEVQALLEERPSGVAPEVSAVVVDLERYLQNRGGAHE